MADQPTVEAAGRLDERIASSLEEFEDVALAYLFGSVVKGTSRPDSDVDVAIYLREASGDTARGVTEGEGSGLHVGNARSPLSGEIPAEERVGIAERAQEIERSLQRDLERAVQVVPLQLAPHGLVHNVLRHGRLVVCRDDRLRARLFVDHARRHFDLLAARKIFDRYRRRRIREGTFGGGSGDGS